MKKSILILSAIVSTVACSKNDDNPPGSDRNNLVGAWNVTNIIYQNTVVGTVEPDVTGSILFREDGTGRENFTYMVSGIPILNISNFTWVSTSEQIVFDEGTNDETTWQRLQNTTTIQVGRFNESTENTTITITLEK